MSNVALLPNGRQQFFDANGNPLVGGQVGMYVPSTLVAKDTFQDSAGSILNANPLTLDSLGSAAIWGSGFYRQIVNDALGNLIWDDVTLAPQLGAGVGGLFIDTLADAQASSIAGGTSSLTLLGYYAAGDGGGSQYVTAAAGAGAGKFQSADGGWWVLSEAYPNVRMFGARGISGDDTTAITNADSFCSTAGVALRFPAGTYGISSAGITRHGCDWVGQETSHAIIKALAQTFSNLTGMVTGTSIHGHLTTGLTFDISLAVLPPGAGNPGNIYWCQQFFTSNNWIVTNCAFLGITAHVIGQAINGGNHWKVNGNYFNQPTPSTSYNQACNVSIAAAAVSDYEFCDNICVGTAFFSNGAFGRVSRNHISGWAFGSGLTFGPLAACIGQVIADNHCRSSGTAVDINATYPHGIECWSAYSTITGNNCSSNAGHGILAGNTNMVVGDNTCFNNGQGVPNSSGSGIAVYAVLNVTAFVFAHSVVSGNNCFDNQGSPTQQYGYAEFFVSGAVTMQDNVLSGNQFNLNATGTMLLESDAHAPGRGFDGPSVWVKSAIVPGTINAGVIYTAASGLFCYGARLGDVVTCSYDQDLKDCVLFGYVQSTNTIFAYIHNITGSNQALTAGNLRVRASKPPAYVDFE